MMNGVLGKQKKVDLYVLTENWMLLYVTSVSLKDKGLVSYKIEFITKTLWRAPSPLFSPADNSLFLLDRRTDNDEDKEKLEK